MKYSTLRHTIEFLFPGQASAQQASDHLRPYEDPEKEVDEEFLFQYLYHFSQQHRVHLIPFELDENDLRSFLDDLKGKALFVDATFTQIHIAEGYERRFKPISVHTANPAGVKVGASSHITFNKLKRKDGKALVLLLSPTTQLFAPDENDDGSKSLEGKPIRRFFRLLRPDKKEIFYLYTYAIFAGLVNLSLPIGIQTTIGLVMGAQVSTSLVVLISLVVFGVLVSGGLQVMQLWIVEAMQQRIFVRSAFEFAYRVPRIKLDALAKQYAPELINRFFDTLTIQKGLPKLLIDFSTAILQVVFGLVLLSFYHAAFVFLGFGLALMVYAIFRLTGPRGLSASMKESKYKYEVVFWLEEVARTMRIFKLGGETQLPLEKTDHLVTNYLEARKKHFGVLMNQYGFIILFKTVITAGLLILGSSLVINQKLNLGQFVAAEIIIILILGAVEKLILSIDNIYDLLTAVEKLGAITDLPLDRENGIPFQYLDQGKGIQLELHELNYKAIDADRLILKNINLRIEPGEKICIAGENGSGKSTLLSVIDGLHESYTGNILFNDIPLQNINLRSLHNYVAENFSRELIFKGTVLENITIGRKDISFERVRKAIHIASLDSFIKNLPEGLDTTLIPEDRTIPNGLVRKLVLARCIAEQPKLMLLEEFLGVFDGTQKKRVVDYLTDHSDMATVLAISNDGYFASRCDKVLVLEKGEIRYFGPYSGVQADPELEQIFN